MTATPTIPVTIGTYEQIYHIMITSAPKAYDGGGIMYMEDTYDSITKQDERIVLVPEDAMEWAKGRYESGLYYFKPADEWIGSTIEEKLWERLYQKGE